MNEYESASFICEISHDEVETQWYKNDNKLKTSDNIKMKQEGRREKGRFSSGMGVGWRKVWHGRLQNRVLLWDS